MKPPGMFFGAFGIGWCCWILGMIWNSIGQPSKCVPGEAYSPMLIFVFIMLITVPAICGFFVGLSVKPEQRP